MVEWSLAEHDVVVVLAEYGWDAADIEGVGADDVCEGDAGFLGVEFGLLELGAGNIDEGYGVALSG